MEINKKAETELLHLIKKDIEQNGKQKYQPVRITQQGKPTKKAIEFNKRMIKEGKMTQALEQNVVYKLKNNQLTKLKVNVKKGKKTVPNPKINKKQVIGNVMYANNVQKTESDKKYIQGLRRKVNTKIKNLSEFDIKVDLTKTNFNSVLDYVLQFRNKNKNWVVVGQDTRGNWITFSINSMKRLKDADNLVSNEGTDRTGSDLEYLIGAIQSKDIELRFFDKTKKNFSSNTKHNGAFFNQYHNLMYVDLSRYDIYSVKPKSYKDNCLYIALKNGGMDINKLNKLKTYLNCSNIPTNKLNKLCNDLDIKIIVSRYRNDNIKTNITYGTNHDEVYNIGLLNEHYFIIEETIYTSYSIKNYFDIYEIEGFNRIIKKKNDSYERSNKRFIDSFTLIKLLLDNSETHLRPIPVDDIVETQFYSKIVENDNLDYSPTDLRPNEYKFKDNNYFQIFFDFETITEGLNHQPYLVCAITQHKEEVNFVGKKCGKDFIDWIKNKFHRKPVKIDKGKDKGCVQEVQLIAHNLRYDFTFIYEYLSRLNPVLKGNSIMGGDARIYVGNNKFIKLIFQDSVNLIPMKLSKFGKTFNLPCEKEIMPYNLYTLKNVEKEWVDLDECLNMYKDEETKTEYLKNIIKWKCLKDDKVNIIKYSYQYCKIDCKVLKEGYEQFQDWIAEITDLDISNYCSIASLGLDYLIKEDCFEGCLSVSGMPQNFIQKCVVGGRTMCKDNKKHQIRNTSIADFDAVSLYPSAMSRMKGFLKGSPKVIQDENKNFDWLCNQDGFFLKVECLNNPTMNLGFPLLSCEVDGIRNFTNDTKGKIFYIDKTCYEDCVNFQGLEFKVICGYYYNEGHNNNINSVIKHLFEQRKKMKKEGNQIQTVYKQLMNSCYGKSLLKPIETETKIISKNDFYKYVSRQYNFIKEMYDAGDIYICKEQKPIGTHFNNVYAGVEILSMSKRIMNEVMVNAEMIGCNMYYTDTDSIHIQEEDIKRLEKVYNKKYNRELIGSDMGQFHTDFEMDGCKDIIATDSIFLGKKCYIDRLKGTNKENGKTEYGYHIRMKGVNEAGIKHYVKTNNDNVKDLMECYESLYTGKRIAFNLLAGGECVKFKYDKNMKVSSVSEFVRTIGF